MLCPPRNSPTVFACVIPSEDMVTVAPVRSRDGPFRVARDDGDILRMTKSQLIQRIADGQSVLASRDVEVAVKMMLEHMTACLGAGGRIEIRGFGSFSLHFRATRAARNPRTGTPIVLLARYAPYFRPGKALRERVDRFPPEIFGDSGGEGWFTGGLGPAIRAKPPP